MWPYPAVVLAGGSPEAYNNIEHPNRVVPEKTTILFTKGVAGLPPHALAIVNMGGCPDWKSRRERAERASADRCRGMGSG